MFGIGPMELVLILVVALLVLGPKRMPELARTLGRGLGEFRRASSDLRQSLALDDLQNDLREGLTGATSIKKPGQDRPAQAGDDLPPAAGEDPAGTSHETSHETSDAADSGEAANTTNTGTDTPAAPPTTRTHPGELPLDADPHTHHESAEDPAAAPTPPAAPTPADAELGNVQVGGTQASGPTSPKRTEPGRG